MNGTISGWLDSWISLAVAAVAVLTWLIKAEIQKFRLEVMKDRETIIREQALIRNDFSNHEESDDGRFKETEKRFDRIDEKLDRFGRRSG